MSGRDCSFASRSSSEHLLTPNALSHQRSVSPTENHSQGAVTPSHTISSNTASLPNVNPQSPLNNDNRNGAPLDEVVNLDHMKLLIHLVRDKSVVGLGSIARSGTHSENILLGLKIGLEAPYLMHQFLAFSARHLAFLHPSRSAFFQNQAFALQTHAVSLFNTACREVDQSNCAAVLLFSSILGHHLLADTLAKRDPGGLDAFMAHYVQCLGVHRGVFTIAQSAWPLLMETELQPILESSKGFTSREPMGNHCDKIKEMVHGSDSLGEDDKEVCQQAIRYLQVGFDSVLAENNEEIELVNRHQMISSWAMLCPPEFTAMLAAKRPEALVLLAHWTVLLHCGREMWQVGDAGVYIFGMILDYLGSEWQPWLEWPRARIAEGFRNPNVA